MVYQMGKAHPYQSGDRRTGRADKRGIVISRLQNASCGVADQLRRSSHLKNVVKAQLQKSVQNGDAGIGALAKTYKEYINAATTELEDRKQKKEDSVKLDPLGVWISDIEKYTPAEYYKDKDLYRDADGIGGYASRFIFRPLKNLLTGSKELDKEFNLSKED